MSDKTTCLITLAEREKAENGTRAERRAAKKTPTKKAARKAPTKKVAR